MMYMKRVVFLILIILIPFSIFADTYANINTRSFSYTIKKEMKDSVKVFFADKTSSESTINAIDSISLVPTDTLSLAYYLVFAVKEEARTYNVTVTVSPFISSDNTNTILPARLYVAKDLSRSNDSIDIAIGENSPPIDLSGYYGPKEITGSPEYYFFGFYFAFPKTIGSYKVGSYNSTVKVEVSGA